MKKLVISAIIFIIIILSMPVKGTSDESHSDSNIKVIPDEAIRLRILANSDNDEDQQLKRMVRDEVNAVISEWVKEITDINQARDLIDARTPEIEAIVADVLKRENIEQDYHVEYGTNVTFPAKLYGNFLYPPGEYEAVLITLGQGKGSNWWCVLFPPLCFLDFSNGTSVASASSDEEVDDKALAEEDDEQAEVKFFLFEWFGWS
ncbi:stage II sporulation protein R [Virgibacillus subterraneus]|uniref:Stage II sporulation protein R n=2 Tax=Virgibacillus TaxID=84406 RepID=A0A1H0YDC0_9BACI|nr:MULTISPECIES: stage II sporulation protein R [Virgibacillus]SDQ12886.1 stage II sporulation protein R [Virgibacillus salinus]SEP72727.1 stage II sporulation protein R [Virgibacillus subterraneus]